MDASLDRFTEEQKEIFRKQIEEWKEQYFGSVFVSEIKDIEFIWRGLTKAEFKKAQEWFTDDFDRAEYVCKTCVLYPEVEDWGTDIPAGIPEALTLDILRESGFTSTTAEVDARIAKYEQEMLTFDNQITCVVKEAFPDIPIEEIENWQFDKILWYYSRAKWILETLRGIKLEKQELDVGGAPPPTL